VESGGWFLKNLILLSTFRFPPPDVIDTKISMPKQAVFNKTQWYFGRKLYFLKCFMGKRDEIGRWNDEMVMLLHIFFSDRWTVRPRLFC
jgi:hypothetical protein